MLFLYDTAAERRRGQGSARRRSRHRHHRTNRPHETAVAVLACCSASGDYLSLYVRPCCRHLFSLLSPSTHCFTIFLDQFCTL